MSNYGTALNYAATAADSLGTASSKFDEAYLESIEAATNRLTAAWQEFSYEVLDSDFIKTLIGWITELVNGLTSLAEHVDILMVLLPTLGSIIIQVFSNKIVAAFKSTALFQKNVGLVTTALGLLASVFAGLEDSMLQGWASLITGLVAFGGAIIAVFKNIQLGLDKIPWVAVISAVLSGIMAVVSAIDTWYVSAEEKAEAAKQAAQEAREAAQEEADQTKELVELYREYKDITAEINEMNNVTEEQKETLLNLQKQIAEAVGGEVEGLDLVNGRIEENIRLLKQKIATQSGEQYSSALSAILAEQESADNAFVTSKTPIGGVGWESIHDIVFEYGSDADPNADEILKIIDNTLAKHGIHTSSYLGNGVWQSGHGIGWNIGDWYAYYDYVYDEDLGPEAYEEAWRDIIEQVELAGYAATNPAYYQQLLELADGFGEYSDNLTTVSKEFLDAAANKYGFGAGIEQIVSQEDYDSAFNIIYDMIMEDMNVLELIERGTIEADDVKKAVENWLKTWYDLSFDSEGNLEETTLSFADFGSSFRDSFEMLQKALDSFNEHSIVTAEIIEEIIEKYPELMKYFKLTEDGYIPAVGPDDLYANYTDIDLLYDWGAHFLQQYVDNLAACTEGTEEWTKANEELSLAMAYVATLIRDEIVEEETEKLEEKQEALEKQLEQYRELIEERKELLNTYKEEIDYQKELEEKQDNVASLQTQLAVARLDTSAAGQARVRELEEELAEAQEELDDFTLEHAIEVLTEQLDTSLEDYEDFIEEQVDRIETAIQNLKFTVNVNPVVPEPSKPEEDEGEDSDSPEEDTDGEDSSDADDGRWKSYQDAADDGYSNIMTALEWVRRKPYGTKDYQEYLDLMYDHYINGKPHPGSSSGGGDQPEAQPPAVKEPTTEEMRRALMENPQTRLFMLTEQEWREVKLGLRPFDTWASGTVTYDEYLRRLYNNYIRHGSYHSGGFVGDISTLKSNEEFAKLLKGEFVSTPAQMDKFMKETFPSMMSTANKGGATYNAPLVSIECGSITQETLPQVKAAVKAAVAEIKTQIDSGISRTGYRRSVNKFSR